MSESRHTPGPWRVRESGGCVVCSNKTICQTIKIEDGSLSITPEVEANARLIAAAPDLLEACKYARDIISSKVEQPIHAKTKGLELLQATIAQAEKES